LNGQEVIVRNKLICSFFLCIIVFAQQAWSGNVDTSAAYMTVFGRPATQVEIDYWKNRLPATQEELVEINMNWLVSPSGAKDLKETVVRGFQQVFQREPTAAEQEQWQKIIKNSRLKYQDFLEALKPSNISPGALQSLVDVNQGYVTAYGRNATQTELDYWKNHTLPKTQEEFDTICTEYLMHPKGAAELSAVVERGFKKVLQRLPTAEEEPVWENKIKTSRMNFQTFAKELQPLLGPKIMVPGSKNSDDTAKAEEPAKPAVSMNPQSRVFVYGRGKDNAIWYEMFDGTNWGDLKSIGGITEGTPDACSPEVGKVTVFARIPPTGELFYKKLTLNSDNDPWQRFNTFFTSDPGVVCRSGGKADIFIRGYEDAAVWHAWYENGTWANRYQHTLPDPEAGSGTFHEAPSVNAIGAVSRGGEIVGGPDACSWGGQRLDVFARGKDEYIWHIYRDDQGVWHEWESLGGLRMTSDPSAAARGNGQMSVFARGENNQLWTITYSLKTDHWGPWLPLGGILAGAPDATRTGDNRIDVFARGADNAMWHTAITFIGDNPDVPSSPGWESLGGEFASDLSAVGVAW
jgi:hypothetical protein